jgi:hypothetical protein
MVKCPFCQFNNEDGALFCEQCKSDLSGVEPVGIPAAKPAGGHGDIPVASVVGGETIPMAHVEPIPMAGFMDVPFAQAIPVEEPSTIPIAGLAMAEPVVPVGESPTVPIHAPEPPHAEPVPAPPAAEPAPPPAAPAAEAPAAPAAPPAPEPAPAAPPPQAAPAPPVAPTPTDTLAPGAVPKLVVLRGQRINAEYPIYEGLNFIGRADEKPVDIDLEDQEPPDRIWSSRQHALITYENGRMEIEDLNSSNGTFLNRNRIYPGQKTPLKINDVIQIGTVQMKVKV